MERILINMDGYFSYWHWGENSIMIYLLIQKLLYLKVCFTNSWSILETFLRHNCRFLKYSWRIPVFLKYSWRIPVFLKYSWSIPVFLKYNLNVHTVKTYPLPFFSILTTLDNSYTETNETRVRISWLRPRIPKSVKKWFHFPDQYLSIVLWGFLISLDHCFNMGPVMGQCAVLIRSG